MKEKKEKKPYNKTKEIAKILYEQHKNSFTTMSDKELNTWIDEQIEKPDIQVAGRTVQIGKGYKKVIWRYVVFIHYWNSPKR